MRLTRQPHPIGSGGSPVDPAEKRTYFLMATGDTVSRRSLGVMEERRGRLWGFCHFHQKVKVNLVLSSWLFLIFVSVLTFGAEFMLGCIQIYPDPGTPI